MNLNEHSRFAASRIDLFASELMEVSKTTPKDFLLVEPYSIGDAYQTLSLVNAFRQKHCRNGEKIHFFCNERALPLVNIFRNTDYAVGMNLTPYEHHLESLAERYGPIPVGRPIPMTPDMYARGWLGRLMLAGVLHGLDAKKMILELERETKPYLPKLDPVLRKSMDEKARSMGLERDSIIIFNHANTMHELDESVFKPLKNIWGDRVYYDASIGSKGAISWAKPINMSIEEIPYFTSFAGTACCIRSGITDLLSCTDANIITIYPNQSMIVDGFGDNEKAVQLFRGLTLDSLGFLGNCIEYPVFCADGDNLDSIANKLETVVSENKASLEYI